MREDNQRVLDNMRARREAIRQNDERQLQAMQADAEYRERAERRNYKVADTNVRTLRQQAEYDAVARQNEITNQQKGLETALNGVAKFSATVSSILKEKEKEKKSEDIKRGAYMRMLYGGQDAAQIEANTGIRIESEARVGLEGTLTIAEAQGAPANEVAKVRYLNTNEALGWRQADAKLKVTLGYEPFLKQKGLDNPDIISTPEAFGQALPNLLIDFLEENDIPYQNPELIGEALDLIQEKNQQFYSGLASKQAEENNKATTSLLTDMALANWSEQGVASFVGIKGLNGGSNEAGHTWFKELATAMDENGEFFLEDVEWQNFDPSGKGVPYFIPGKGTGAHERKGIDIANTRAELKRTWNKNQATTEKQQYKEESKAWHRHIVIEGKDTPEDFAAALESFRDNVDGIPEWLRKLTNAGDASQASYNSGLITQAKDFQARGLLYQELVDKVFERDPKLGNELQKSLDEQDPFMRNDRYKDLHGIVGKMNTAKDQVTGQYPQDTVSSYNDSKKLQESFEQLVKNGVADGASIDDASTAAGNIIQRGFKDESSPFYRSYNPNTGFYEFPKLYEKTPKEIADSLDQADKQFAKNLAAGKIQDMFSEPDIVLTNDQYKQQVAGLSRPGFAFHPRIDMIVQSGLIKGSHMEILQAIGEAKGEPPIVPPPSMQVVTDYPPEANRMLALWGPRSSNIEARANGAGQKNLAPEVSLALVPERQIPNLRRFYRSSAARHGISPAENAAMGEIESTHGTANLDERGVSVSYNGTSEGPMMINKRAHPEFYAKHNGNPSAEANIDYGTQYYAELKKRYNGDMIAAAMAYNGGPGNYDLYVTGKANKIPPVVLNEMLNHGKKFAKAYYKYSGDSSLLQHPILLRN